MAEFSVTRYDSMEYRRCGRSGLRLPAVSLGCRYGFGGPADENHRNMLVRAFDLGITHFDLANSYGPPPGSSERNVGRILKKEFVHHRDELVISTMAGYPMWPGPYGDLCSKKHLVASLEQSLKRLQVDYVDIFYSHRYDPETPLEETMEALELVVRQGKALYVGLSNYSPVNTTEAAQLYARKGSSLLVQQAGYSLLDRWPEQGLLDALQRLRLGMIACCPLSNGLLSDRYLRSVPRGSRAAQDKELRDRVTPKLQSRLRKLCLLALQRGQTLPQLALNWVLRDARISSAVFGADTPAQIEENVQALSAPPLSTEELIQIDRILAEGK